MRIIRRVIRVFPALVVLLILAAVGVIALGRIQRVIEAQGEVRVDRYQVVRPQVSGLVTEVRAEPGEAVHRGEVLLQLQDYQFQRQFLSARQSREEVCSKLQKLRLEQRLRRQSIHPLEIERQEAELARGALEAELATSRVTEAELAVESARERRRQAEELADAGLISQREQQEARQQELTAEQRLLQARIAERSARMIEPSLATDLELLASEHQRRLITLEAEIAELEAQAVEWAAQVEQLQELDRLHTLRASLDGVLVGPPVHELLGQYVEAGQELLTVIDTASIQFVSRVPENALVQVRSGQPAQVEIVGLPKTQFRLFTGWVRKVLPEPDLGSTAGVPIYPVEIGLTEPWIALEEGRFYLRNGMRGTARIAYRRDVPMLRAVYEFLLGRPQLPDSRPAGESFTTARKRGADDL